jgi:DNA-directed RNA polymerase I subunit RPA2
LRFLLSRFFFFLFVFVCPPFFFEDYLKAGTVLTTLAADYDLSQQPESFFKQKLVSSGFFMSSIGSAISSFVATGNFQAKFCSDLQQETGFVILAEKLNHLRYTAHFRCVHRGAYFQEMKTTTVRKLMPESWGFLCPVHTPDGGPCGLLNHLAADCVVDAGWWDVRAHFGPMMNLLQSLGLIAAERAPVRSKHALPVLLDGVVAGELPDVLLPAFIATLRSLKRSGQNPHVSPHLEVVSVPRGGSQYPGVWMFSGQGRPMRAVRSLTDGKVEFIGAAEQPYLDIAVDAASVTPQTQYIEQSPVSMLSLVARLTPFCDFNQRFLI